MKKYSETGLAIISALLIVSILLLLVAILSTEFSIRFWLMGGVIVLSGAWIVGTEIYIKRKISNSEQRIEERLRREMDGLDKKEAEEGESEKNAELFALQNQINPHFLYNTLDAIRGHALESEVDDIAEMTAKLSQFFRYSISNPENLVTLMEELDNTSDYFCIQKYRFEERFTLIIEGDEDYYNRCYLPKLTLQPIVENAVYHGLEPRVGQGEIKIRIEVISSMVTIVVMDNGIGMSEEMVIKMNQDLLKGRGEWTSRRGRGEKHGGMALNNVNRRIKLLFGENYGVHVNSILGMGTDVEVTIPYVTDEIRMQYKI